MDTLYGVKAASIPIEKEVVGKPVNSSTQSSQQVDGQGIACQLIKNVVDTPIKASDLVTNPKPAATTFNNGISKSTYHSPERKGVSPQLARLHRPLPAAPCHALLVLRARRIHYLPRKRRSQKIATKKWLSSTREPSDGRLSRRLSKTFLNQNLRLNR